MTSNLIRATGEIFISPDEIEERFTRAPGPGGQNVNKVETAVQLRFDAKASPSISHAVFNRLKALSGRRMTADGVVLIVAHTYRTRERNRADALERLLDLIRKAAKPPKARHKTRPTLASKRRRMDSKRKRGETKKNRASVSQDH